MAARLSFSLLKLNYSSACWVFSNTCFLSCCSSRSFSVFIVFFMFSSTSVFSECYFSIRLSCSLLFFSSSTSLNFSSFILVWYSNILVLTSFSRSTLLFTYSDNLFLESSNFLLTSSCKSLFFRINLFCKLSAANSYHLFT